MTEIVIHIPTATVVRVCAGILFTHYFLNGPVR